MRFTKSYHARKRREKARVRSRAVLPYQVVVMNKKSNEAVEVKRFSSYEAADAYAGIYRNSSNLTAWVDLNSK